MWCKSRRSRPLLPRFPSRPSCCDAPRKADETISPTQQTCILSSITNSECKTITNTTCLCTSEQVFDLTLDCLLSYCNTTDALLTAKLETDACQKPQRNQKPELLAPLSIELLGFICVIIRFYSRWRFTPRYEIDDWVMLVCIALYVPFEIIGHYSKSCLQTSTATLELTCHLYSWPTCIRRRHLGS